MSIIMDGTSVDSIRFDGVDVLTAGVDRLRLINALKNSSVGVTANDTSTQIIQKIESYLSVFPAYRFVRVTGNIVYIYMGTCSSQTNSTSYKNETNIAVIDYRTTTVWSKTGFARLSWYTPREWLWYLEFSVKCYVSNGSGACTLYTPGTGIYWTDSDTVSKFCIPVKDL